MIQINEYAQVGFPCQTIVVQHKKKASKFARSSLNIFMNTHCTCMICSNTNCFESEVRATAFEVKTSFDDF